MQHFRESPDYRLVPDYPSSILYHEANKIFVGSDVMTARLEKIDPGHGCVKSPWVSIAELNALSAANNAKVAEEGHGTPTPIITGDLITLEICLDNAFLGTLYPKNVDPPADDDSFGQWQFKSSALWFCQMCGMKLALTIFQVSHFGEAGGRP